MKAIVVNEYGQPEVMKYIETDVPKIDSTQVLIKVKKSSVNFADVKARYGRKGGKTLPFIPGIDTAGIVVEIGSEIKHLSVGQRVIAFPATGSYAEYVAANANLTFAIPDNIPFHIAAACPTVTFLSYKLLVDIARIEKGESILIHSAAGGVGSTAIQLAKLLGAGKIIGTVGNENKMQIALQTGADHVICYEKEDFPKSVNELTDGKGVNIILDSIAGTVTEKSLTCLAQFGRLVQFGNSGGKSGSFKTSDVHSSCRSVLGFSLGTTRKYRPETLQQTARQVLQFISDGQLTMHIGHQFPLKDAFLAHQLIESRGSVGKIILNVDE